MDGHARIGAGRGPIERRVPIRSVEPHTEVLVAGLRWDTQARGARADLDLSCALVASDLAILDTVTPHRRRSANASVVHTGDSTDGAGAWDDERVFIFLDQVPAAVEAILLVVASASGEPLARIPNAYCHVSDHESDETLLDAPLTRVVEEPVHCIATVWRRRSGWQLVRGCPDEARAAAILHQLRAAACAKSRSGNA